MVKILVNKMPSHTFVSDCPFMDADRPRSNNCTLGDKRCPLYGEPDANRNECEYLMSIDSFISKPTCRELAATQYPNKIDPDAYGGVVDCPDDYGYLPYEKGLCRKEDCSYGTDICTRCWDQIAEVENNG